MAPQKLTEYERKRLENIRRNNEMMAALKVHSKATELSIRPKYSFSSLFLSFSLLFFLLISPNFNINFRFPKFTGSLPNLLV